MVRRRDLSGPQPDEAGFTLIELLIYSVLSVVVLLVVGGFLINSLGAERTVRDATQASTDGQLVARSLGHGVRSASAITLSEPSTGSQLLMVRTATSGSIPTWACQAWYYGAGEVRTKSSDVAILPPTPSEAREWTLLADGVEPVPSVPVFALGSRSVDLNLQADTGEGSPVLIRTTASSRQPVPPTGEGTSPCF